MRLLRNSVGSTDFGIRYPPNHRSTSEDLCERWETRRTTPSCSGEFSVTISKNSDFPFVLPKSRRNDSDEYSIAVAGDDADIRASKNKAGAEMIGDDAISCSRRYFAGTA